jgi:anti-sigma B factor antagonist
MHFITDQQDDTTIFRLREERLDSRNAGQLKAEFLILAQPDIQNLIVDLSEVRHIDSAGLSALLLAQRQMTVHEGELRLTGVSGEVLSLLEMTQLDRVFRIFNTTEEAIAAPPVFRDAWERKAWEETHTREEMLAEKESGSQTIRAGAMAVGGSLGAAALANIIMNTPMDDELELPALYALGDEEDDDDLDDDDFDDDLDDDLDEEDDIEEEADVDDKDKAEAEDVVEPEDLDEDFEDDDWDDEELEDDDEDDY